MFIYTLTLLRHEEMDKVVVASVAEQSAEQACELLSNLNNIEPIGKSCIYKYRT